MQRVQRIEGTFVRVAEEAPELARPFLEAIASDKRFDDRLSRAAKSTLDMIAGSNVMDAVKRLAPSLATIESGTVQLPGKQLLLNGLIKFEGRSVGIDVRRRPGGWESFCQTVAEAMDLERLDYVVVVLAGAASKEKKEMQKAAAYDGSCIAICTWNSAKDDEGLKRALLQALRPGRALQR